MCVQMYVHVHEESTTAKELHVLLYNCVLPIYKYSIQVQHSLVQVVLVPTTKKVYMYIHVYMLHDDSGLTPCVLKFPNCM